MGQQARERGGKKNWTIDGTGELFASIFYNAAVRFPTFPFYFLLSVVCEKKDAELQIRGRPDQLLGRRAV